jgi:para-nitrobenzyl esterase
MNPRAETRLGPLRGATDETVLCFRSVPYALPPVGRRRWRPPEPPEPWPGTLDARRFGPAAPQLPRPDRPILPHSEDCLTLNVWTPPFTSESVPAGTERLPVMVWIHGGGNTIGHASFFDGGNLAASQRVVVVTVQYRLGPFGWFRLPALGAPRSTAEERSGNFATLDLIRALVWVRDNIAAFGGDPRNVTIFGESAGGQNVFTLLLAPPAKGLFHRAIVQSGGMWHVTPAEATNDSDAPVPGHAQSAGEIVLRLFERDGAADRAAARARRGELTDAALAAWLRGRSTHDVMAAYTAQPTGMIDLPRAIADGKVLPSDDWLARLRRRTGWNRVPVMLGTTRDENKLFMFADPQWVKRRFWLLPRLVDPTMYDVVAEYSARMWKAVGADEPAAAMRTHQPRVFVYRFDWDEEPTVLGADLGVMLGAAHAFEIPFVFGHWDLGREGNVLFTDENLAGRTALSDAMMGYWAEFARAGAPEQGTTGELAPWEPWKASPAGKPTFLVLDTPAGGGVHMERGAESVAGVLAAVDRDPRLGTQRARCRVYHALADWGPSFTRRDYPRAGRQGCAEFPWDTWNEGT